MRHQRPSRLRRSEALFCRQLLYRISLIATRPFYYCLTASAPARFPSSRLSLLARLRALHIARQTRYTRVQSCHSRLHLGPSPRLHGQLADSRYFSSALCATVSQLNACLPQPSVELNTASLYMSEGLSVFLPVTGELALRVVSSASHPRNCLPTARRPSLCDTPVQLQLRVYFLGTADTVGCE